MDKAQIKAAVIAKLEEKYGIGKVSIYANGSIFANGRLQGNLSDFAKEFAPTEDQKNQQQMMNTGYGIYD